jgi:hypothetical protein
MTMHCNSTRLGLLVLLSIAGSLLCHAFVAPSRNNPLSRTAGRSIDTTAFLAQRKRRRKPPSEQSPSESLPDFESEEKLDGELPDFDLDGEEKESPKPKKKVITNPDEITAEMMGNTNGPVRSVKDLITDRALESKFQFDEEEDDSVPDFVVLAGGSSRIPEPAPVGTKKARQAVRMAAAIASKEEEEEESILSKIPFVTDEKGDVNAVKVCC